MEDWRIEKDKALELSDFGYESGIDPSALERRSVSGGLRSKIVSLEDDERRLSENRRTSVGWTLPEREASEEFLRRNTLTLGIEDLEEKGLLKEINHRDRVLLERACCSEDVIRVWNHISFFIINRLKEGTGVQIPGLYTITYQVEKTIMPNDKQYYVLKRIPIMIMSRSVIETYGLKNKVEEEYVFRAPSVALNLTEVGNKTKLSRNVVDGAVTEVLQAFARALVSNKKIEFPLPNIGKLQVQDRQAVMKFYEQFYKTMGYDMEPSSNLLPFRRRRLSSRLSTEEEPPLSLSLPENDFDILPGQMTPLRQHIPSETYRSVFHLREVRSVHDTELLAPVEIHDRPASYKFRRSVLRKDFPDDPQERLFYISQDTHSSEALQEQKVACEEDVLPLRPKLLHYGGSEPEPSEGPYGLPMEELLQSDDGEESSEERKTSPALVEKIDVGSQTLPNIDWHHPELGIESPGAAKPGIASKKRESLFEKKRDSVRAGSTARAVGSLLSRSEGTSASKEGFLSLNSEEPKTRMSLTTEMKAEDQTEESEILDLGKTKEGRNSVRRVSESADLSEKERKDSRKPVFIPKQLYSVKPTGKFTIDMIMGNTSLYTDLLFNHHHRMCSDVLGMDEVLKHYARRARLPTKARSYDDNSDAPPSP